jgi:glycosyltransferase involved in cell wall biosynthesis
MRVAGFTFIRNALINDYPIVEAIRSILPLCDEVVVAVGRSDDDTLGLIQQMNEPKIRIVETVWDDNLRTGGRVLAVETDKAFDAIGPGFDWCIYIQGDECLHEADFSTIRTGMEHWLHDARTEGLLLNYRHFYGSYDFVAASRKWYRREVRIVRPNSQIRSYRDAQGFRWDNGKKLRVRRLDATVYHYGWVKHPDKQRQKQLNFNRLWHSDVQVAQMMQSLSYTYNGSEALTPFSGAHPAVIQPRIAAMNWQFEVAPTGPRQPFKYRLSDFIERLTGWRPFEYRNYHLLGQ